MRLYSIERYPATRTAVLVGTELLDFARAGEVLPLARWVPTGMPDLLAGGEPGLDVIRRLLDQIDRDGAHEQERLRHAGALRPVGEVTLAPAVPRPGILLSHGRAYKSHRDEMLTDAKVHRSDIPREPKAFMKNVNSVIGSGEPIVTPRQFPDKVDYEAEFSIVFGADCYDVTPQEALATVAGYTMVNDVGARDSAPPPVPGEPIEWDLVRMGKQLRTFAPLGPCITTKDEIGDPMDVRFTTRLNGAVMQDACTSDLIWDIPFMISYFSRFYPFRAGDVLTTGSPAGVGHAQVPPIYMHDGDVVEVASDRIGVLRNPIVSADRL